MGRIARNATGEEVTLEEANLELGPIRRDDEGRWVWTVTDNDSYDGTETRTFCTDRAGTGLWAGDDNLGRQILGHAQFDLRGTASARRRRVAREMVYRYGY